MLLPLETVLEKLLSEISPISQPTEVPLFEANDRILAETLCARVDVPPCDNSAVDGYALNTRDCRPGVGYPVSQRIPAGQTPAALTPGTMARIFTGAHVPAGADCVIMQEDCTVTDEKVRFECEAQTGQNIRPLGQDLRAGNNILFEGQILTPQSIGLAASSGYATLPVRAPLNVAILSTGDELVEPGNPLPEGKIYNSNRYLLWALLKNFGCNIIDLGVVEDTLSATTGALERAVAEADLVISTGGASVGEEDHVKNAIQQLGSLSLWRIALKPGKPFMFGQVNDTPIIGLPGNPGAVLVTSCLLARPAILKRMGYRALAPRVREEPLGFAPGRNGKRREFKRVQINQEGRLIAHENQSSGMLSSACWADGLAVIPEHSELSIGDHVEFLSFSELMHLPYEGVSS